ncbi:hypothetical protein GCM10022226_46290 [Sphaerisporangium flaviroseum]|uniref:Uncharacterized protein n=1 Tax=Sphaerisporangium flaviroseum TaxID=509199 RepID=A0ABP7IKR2_9ACTN
MLAIYMHGCYGWLISVLAGIVLRPDAFEMVFRESGLPGKRAGTPRRTLHAAGVVRP